MVARSRLFLMNLCVVTLVLASCRGTTVGEAPNEDAQPTQAQLK